MINENIGPSLRVFIGVAELLAAVGLLLPGITRILPSLTTWAAGGLAIVMSCATVFHLVCGETESAISTLVILVLVSVVVYARSKVLIIAGDADGFPPAHAAQFFALLGGGQRDGSWDRSGMAKSQLAILPNTTHYDIDESPALPALVNAFLAGGA